MTTRSAIPPDSAPPNKTWNESASATWVRRCLIVFTMLGCVALVGVGIWLVTRIAGALVLFVIAGVLSYVIFPLVRILQRYIPSFLAILIVYIVIFGLLMTFLYVVGLTAVGQLINLVNVLQYALPQFVSHMQPLLHTLNQWGISPGQLRASGQQIVSYLFHFVIGLQPILFSLFDAFISIILVTTLSIYFVIYGPRFDHWLRTQTPIKHRATIVFFLQTVDRTMGGFIRGQLFLGALMSVIIGFGLFLLGVPYAVLLATVVFVFEFIPQIGVYISGTIIILFALVTRGWQIGLIVLVFSSFVQGILDGQILAPRIIGHSVGLNPIISIFALLVGAQLFGLIGAFFSAPIAGVIQVFVMVGYFTWKRNHPEQFPDTADEDVAKEVEQMAKEPGMAT